MQAENPRRVHTHLSQRQNESGELQQPLWVADIHVTGGFLYESTVHLLDMVRWLMGDIVEVECRARSNFTTSSTTSSWC
jgi:myo-inositol 2-dehydrogenase/D-chiro-inositol 1-dehydrogenase